MDLQLKTKPVKLIIDKDHSTISEIGVLPIDSKQLMNTIVKCGYKLDVTENGVEFHGKVDLDKKVLIKLNRDGSYTLPHSMKKHYSL